MKAFDVNEYRRTVLSRLKDDHSLADPQSGDVLWVCAVEPSASATDALKRLDDVVAAWQKDRNHPKYKGICAVLVGHRAAYAQVLGNPAARARASVRQQEQAAATSARAVNELDALAGELVRQRGGIPADRVPALRAVAEQDGLDAVGFTTWLSAQRVLGHERGAGAVPWEPMVRKQVREQLARLANADPDVALRTATLLTLLGVAPNAGVAQVRAAHARLAAANLHRQRDTVMTLTSDLLAHVSKRMFTEQGLESYTASLHADARDEVRGPLRRAAIVSGSVDASQVHALVMTVVGLRWGIDQHAARDIVTEAAQGLGVPVEVATDVTVVVCGACGRPQSPGRERTCAYCAESLFTDCPRCRAQVESATQICPQCGCDIALQVAAIAAVSSAQRLLGASAPVAARTLCLDAVAGADPAHAPPALRAVLVEAGNAIDEAYAQWAEVGIGLSGSRAWHAARSLDWLVRNAADVPQPETGRSVHEVHAQVRALQQQVEQWVNEAIALAPDEIEVRLCALDQRFPEAPPVQNALAQLPLAPPRDVRSVVDGTSLSVSWVPAPSRGASYRVERHIVFPRDARTSHVVGTTSATALEDAGVPIGVAVRYTVTAAIGARMSPAAASPEPGVFLDGDVEAVSVAVEKGDVVLSWPVGQLRLAKVVVEREVDASAAVTAPVRRLIPHEPGRLVDERADPGVQYRYRVALRYVRPDGIVVNTPGTTVTAAVVTPPVPVKELWSSGTDEAGVTIVSFHTVPTGDVLVYADGAGWPVCGTTMSTTELSQVVAATHARAVGFGRRRVSDPVARGRIRYRAVTVHGDQVVIGAELSYVAVPSARHLQMVRDDGDEVVVGFELPSGVTEAFVAWQRNGQYPRSANQAAHDGGGSVRVTNAKLDIDGGVSVPAPDDGRGLLVVVFAAVRVDGELVPAQTGPSLVAREPRPVRVCYDVQRTGLLRRKVLLSVRTAGGGPLPDLVVHAISALGLRRTVATVTAGAPKAEYVLPCAPFGPDTEWTVEVTSAAPPGSVVTFEHPAEEGRQVQP